ncbi:hypothetical protein GCM10020216_004590 [Nonomuraea helvata]
MAQKASAGVVCSSVGRVAMSGTIRVCISETVMPAAASTLMIAPLRWAADVELMSSPNLAWICTMHTVCILQFPI